jgi:hypothetical protein
MIEIADDEHIKAMNIMKDLINIPRAIKEWMESKKKEFNVLPKD